MGRIAKADPTIWKMVEGKLYLNCSEAVKRMWEEDIPGHIEKANENWPSLLK